MKMEEIERFVDYVGGEKDALKKVVQGEIEAFGVGRVVELVWPAYW